MKLAALSSVPGAPVNFGHFGHSHSGRERLALGLPSTAVSPLGAWPFSTQFCSAVEAVDLRVERTEAVAEAGNHVEAHEAVDAGLAELLRPAACSRASCCAA